MARLVSAFVGPRLRPSAFGEFFQQVLESHWPVTSYWRAGPETLLSSTLLQSPGCSLRGSMQLQFVPTYQLHINHMPYKRHQNILLLPFHHTERDKQETFCLNSTINVFGGQRRKASLPWTLRATELKSHPSVSIPLAFK